MKYRVALGLDWIVDLGEQNKGIELGSDQMAPFAGIAMGVGGSMLMVWVVSVLIGLTTGVLARGYDLITDTLIEEITYTIIRQSKC